MLVTTIEMAVVGDVSVFVAAALDISLFVSGLCEVSETHAL